jgi:hypothetical protein
MTTDFSFRIPDTWTDYHLATEDFVERRAQLRAQAGSDTERDDVDGAVRIAREFVTRARRQGAVSAAGVMDLSAEGLLMAFVMAAGLQIPEGQEASLQALVRDLAAPATGPDGTGERTAGAVTLPHAGPAARVTGTELVEITPGVSAAMLTMTTIIPVPGTTRGFVVLTAVSPNLPLADDLLRVFAEIADTFAFEPAMAGA